MAASWLSECSAERSDKCDGDEDDDEVKVQALLQLRQEQEQEQEHEQEQKQEQEGDEGKKEGEEQEQEGDEGKKEGGEQEVEHVEQQVEPGKNEEGQFFINVDLSLDQWLEAGGTRAIWARDTLDKNAEWFKGEAKASGTDGVALHLAEGTSLHVAY